MSISRFPPVSPSRPRRTPRSSSKAPTSSWSDRLPRTSASGARPSPTRARASATRVSTSSARKARRSKGWRYGTIEKRAVPEAPPAQPEQDQGDGRRASAPVRTPLQQEHQRAADRRRRRQDARLRIVARGGAGHCRQEQRGGRREG